MDIKQHDWFATFMYQPDLSIERMHDLGITPSTSSMKSRDEYKNIQAVIDNPAFQDDNGKFDENKFNKFYDSVLLAYNQTAELEYLGKIESSFEYDPWAWYAADKDKKRNTAPVGIINPNPWRNEYGIDGLGKINPGRFSAREIGQDQYYYDSEKGEFSDKKPNDFVGILKSFKAPRLVLDTYEEDTPEIINGKEIIHEKGSFKLNSYGAPYYRTLLPDEEIYDKDLLHVTDIWSVDGVGINKYDPFDSDGLTTEPWKVVTKNLLRIAPFLIGGEVGLVIKGLSAAAALFEFMPTFLKAVDGIATGNAMDNEFGKNMNQLESWLGRLDFSVSDRSREKLVTFENIGNMFADVTAQLFQQKAVAHLPQSKLFKNVDWMRNNAKVGRALSYAYMSATSSKEAYSIFKNAGANDVTSGLAMLALMGVYYKLMSSDYFKDVLFKGTRLDESNYKRITWGVLQDFKNATSKGELSEVASPEMAKETFNWFQKAWTKAIGTIPVEGKGFAMGALSEGVEETMEEIGIDALKGLAAGMNALGIPVTKENEELDFGYSWDDVKTRYLTSFFGGAFGGAVFHGYNLADPAYRKSIRTARQLAETPDGRIAELVNLATQNRLNDVKRYATKLANKGLVGNESLSGTLFEAIDSPDGKIEVADSSEKSISQNELVYDAFMKQINFIESILSDEGFLKARDQIAKSLKFDKTSAGVRLFESLGVNDLIRYDINRLGTDIVKLRAKMQDIADTLRPTDENYDKTEFEKKLKNNEQYKQYEEELKELRKEFDELRQAKNISKYITPALLVRNNPILKAFVGFSNIDEYTQANYYGKHFEDFNEAQQLLIQKDYEAYKSGEKKHIFELSEIYRVLSELMTNDLVTLDKKYTSLKDDLSVDITTYGNEYLKNVEAKTNLYVELSKLNEKENLNDAELERKAAIESEIERLNALIDDFKRNSYLISNQVEKSPIDYDNRVEGAQKLLEYYKSLAGKFKYSDGELDDFFHKLRRQYLGLDIKAITEEWINSQSDSEDINFDDPGSFYRTTDETDVRNDFYNLLYKFYNEIWVDNDGANKTYDAIVDLLKTRVGMSDEQITSLLNNQIVTGQITTVDKGDGNIEIVRLTDSLIPQIGDLSVLDYIKELNKARTNIIYSDLFTILNKFSVATEDSELIDMIRALQDEESKVVGNLENYRIGDALIKSKLDKAQLYLNAVYAIIAGAGTEVNKIINEYRNNEKKQALAEISSETRGKLLKQIKMLNNRIDFIKGLHELNSGQKMRQQKEIGVNVRLGFLSNFKEKVYIEEFKKEFQKDGKIVDPEDILKNIDFDHITIENFDDHLKEIVDAESKLYEEVQALGFNNAEIAAKLVNVFGKNSAWRQRSTKLIADKNNKVTDYDQIVYAASVLSLHSGAFFYREKTILEELKNLGEINIVPVFSQEHALRIIYSFVHNKELFNELAKQIKSSYPGTDKYVIDKIVLNNMVSVFGGAGTGKTEGVGWFLSKLFDNVEFLCVGPTQNQVNKLLRIFKLDKERGKTFEEFFNTVAPQYLDSSNFKYNEDSSTIISNDPSINFKDWWSTENDKVRIILIDEAGLANSQQLDVFSRYISNFGGYAVTLGDTKQNTGTLTYIRKETTDVNNKVTKTFETTPDGFEDTVGIRTPHLKATFRAENRAKADNYDKLDHRLEVIDDKIQSSEEPIVESKRDELVEVIPTELDYYLYEDHIAGDYITNDEKQFKSLLDRLVDKGETNILLITDSESVKKYQDPKYDGKIITQDAYNAQGGEYRYVFVDKKISNSKYDNLKDVYTTSQRASLASIILDPNGVYFSLGIKSHERKDSDLPYIIPDDERRGFMDWYLKCLEKLEMPENYEDLIKIPLNTTVASSNTVTKEEPEPQQKQKEEPEPEPTPKAEPAKPEVKETPVQVNQTPEEEVKKEEKVQAPIQETKVIPLVETAKKEKPVFEDKTPVDEKPENYEEQTEPEEQIKEKLQTIASSQKFFDLIYGNDFGIFFNNETINPTSLWTFVKNNGVSLNKNEYQSVMLMLHKAVMNNIPIQHAISRATLKMDTQKTLNFKRIFQDDNLVFSLWNINADGNSNINLVITHAIDTKIQHSIIVGNLQGEVLPDGRFSENTRFWTLKRPNYTRNDKEWITIQQLKVRFPWLNIASRGGIPINSDSKQKASNYNDQTKLFLEQNDGKLLGFGYDVSEIDEELLLETTTLLDGTLYLHKYPYSVRTFGIQKRVRPVEIAAYAACIYYLQNKGYSPHNVTGNTLSDALVNLGVVENGSKTSLDDICKYLEKTTKNPSWLELPGLSKDTTDDEHSLYYDKLRKCCMDSPIVTRGVVSKIATDILGSVLNNDSQLSDIRLTNLFYELTKKDYIDDKVRYSKRSVLVLSAMDLHYMIKSRQDESEWKLELYQCKPNDKSYTIIGAPIVSYNLRAATFNNTLKQIITRFGQEVGGMPINAFNSYNVTMKIRTESTTDGVVNGYYSQNPASALYSLFGYSFVSSSNYEKALNPNRFKYGINGAVVKSGNALGDQMAPATITDDMVTNASHWTASTYGFTGDIIEGALEDPNTANRTILYNQANNWLDEMAHSVQDILPEFNQLAANLMETLRNDPELNDETLETYFNNFIDQINNRLLQNTFELRAIQFRLNDSTLIKEEITDDTIKKYAYSNIIKTFDGIDENSINEPLFSDSGIDVIRNSDRVFVIYQDKSGTLQAKETKTFDSWLSAWNYVSGLERMAYNVSTLTYLLNLLTDTVTDEQVDEYLANDASTSDNISKYITNYLEQRLLNEEC